MSSYSLKYYPGSRGPFVWPFKCWPAIIPVITTIIYNGEHTRAKNNWISNDSHTSGWTLWLELEIFNKKRENIFTTLKKIHSIFFLNMESICNEHYLWVKEYKGQINWSCDVIGNWWRQKWRLVYYTKLTSCLLCK